MGISEWFKDIFSSEEEEEYQEPLGACSRCGFEFADALLVNNETGSFCAECNQKQKKEAEELAFRKKQAAALQKNKFYCYDCKFHFSRKQDFSIRLCPNCGSENFVEENKLI